MKELIIILIMMSGFVLINVLALILGVIWGVKSSKEILSFGDE